MEVRKKKTEPFLARLPYYNIAYFTEGEQSEPEEKKFGLLLMAPDWVKTGRFPMGNLVIFVIISWYYDGYHDCFRARNDKVLEVPKGTLAPDENRPAFGLGLD